MPTEPLKFLDRIVPFRLFTGSTIVVVELSSPKGHVGVRFLETGLLQMLSS